MENTAARKALGHHGSTDKKLNAQHVHTGEIVAHCTCVRQVSFIES